MSGINLDAYMDRLGISGSVRPDLESLERLLSAHMCAIPFENIDILMGRPIRLDAESLQRKLVQERRGGNCFEHVTLFSAALSELGFRPSCHLARVLLTAPKVDAPRTHMFALVDLPEGQFVVDPGFGGLAATAPIPLVEVEWPDTVRDGHWFFRAGRSWILRAAHGDAVLDLWATELSEDLPIDFVLSSHFVSTHPDSIFTHSLMINCFTKTGRISIMNRDVTIRDGSHTTAWKLEDTTNLHQLLLDRFGIDVPYVGGISIPALRPEMRTLPRN